jgi:pimeloyl-ACP methyl ester carboxylesterase
VGAVDLFVRELRAEQSPEPPLVVIHGGPDWDHTYLLPGLLPVAGHRHVILFDMRGCGRSTRDLAPAEYQPEFVVEDIAGLVQVLGHHRIDLLGFSTGGQVAQLLIEAHPDLVRRLILASTTAYPQVGQYVEGWAEYQRRRSLAVPSPEWAQLPDGEDLAEDSQVTIRWAVEAAPTAIWNLQRLDEYLTLLGKVCFSGNWLTPFREGRLHPWRPNDPEQVLRDFGGPILILHGAQDMGFPVQVAERLHEAVPATQLRIIDEAGHMAQFDQSQAWATAVIDFLAG